MKTIPISKIGSDIRFDSFDCGIDELNEYLKKYARQNDRKNIGKTVVCLNDNEVIGYITVCTASISKNDVPPVKNVYLPKYPVPAIRIARFAVDLKYQNQGIGRRLLWHTFQAILAISEEVGCKLIVVDSKDNAIGFYKHFGFIPLLDNEQSLFIFIETIRDALSDN